VAFLPIRDMHKRFDATEVPHGVSVETGNSACKIAMGRPGCGKSTLPRTIARLETIGSGGIAVTARRAGAHLFDAGNHQRMEGG